MRIDPLRRYEQGGRAVSDTSYQNKGRNSCEWRPLVLLAGVGLENELQGQLQGSWVTAEGLAWGVEIGAACGHVALHAGVGGGEGWAHFVGGACNPLGMVQSVEGLRLELDAVVIVEADALEGHQIEVVDGVVGQRVAARV